MHSFRAPLRLESRVMLDILTEKLEALTVRYDMTARGKPFGGHVEEDGGKHKHQTPLASYLAN